VSENWAETHQSCRLALEWKAYLPLPMGTGTIPAKRSQILGRSRGDSLYSGRSWEAKMEIPAYSRIVSRRNMSRSFIRKNWIMGRVLVAFASVTLSADTISTFNIGGTITITDTGIS